MKNKRLVVGLSIVLVALLAIFAMVFITNRPDTTEGKKNIDVTIVYADKETKELDIDTDADYLADALFEEKIITEAEYKSGFYTEIDGVKADFDKDKAWWCVTKGGEMTTAGMNELALKDGDKYEITYTID